MMGSRVPHDVPERIVASAVITRSKNERFRERVPIRDSRLAMVLGSS